MAKAIAGKDGIRQTPQQTIRVDEEKAISKIDDAFNVDGVDCRAQSGQHGVVITVTGAVLLCLVVASKWS